MPCAQSVLTADAGRDTAKPRLVMSYELRNAGPGRTLRQPLAGPRATQVVPASLAMSYDLALDGQTTLSAPARTARTDLAPAGLLQLATSALANQPTLRAAAARARADGEKVEQARGALRFNANGSLTYQREFEQAGNTIPYRNQAGGVQITYPLYRPQASANIDVAQLQFESTTAQRAETGNDLLAALVTGYFGAVQQATETRTLIAERELLLAQRHINERRMQGGVGTRVDVLETMARAELLTGQVSGSEGAERILLAELARLAVMPVAAIRTMKDESPALAVPINAEEALAAARRNSSTLLRLQKALASARANVGAQRDAHLPTVDLVANLVRSRFQQDGTANQAPLTGQAPSTAVGVQLSVPLYSGGITSSKVREAMAQVERSEEELKDAENTLQSEMMKAYADLVRAQSQASANVAALGVSQSAMDATVRAFSAGARSNIDVLNAQQQTFSTRREVARSRVAIQLAQTRILSLIGDLDLSAVARLAQSLAGGG